MTSTDVHIPPLPPITRIDGTKLEDEAKQIAITLYNPLTLQIKILSLTNWLTSINDSKSNSKQRKQIIEQIQRVFIALPYVTLNSLFIHCEQLEKRFSHLNWKQYLNTDVINECMKRSEFIVRRSKLKETLDKKIDRGFNTRGVQGKQSK
jgi:hypothetical protein